MLRRYVVLVIFSHCVPSDHNFSTLPCKCANRGEFWNLTHFCWSFHDDPSEMSGIWAVKLLNICLLPARAAPLFSIKEEFKGFYFTSLHGKIHQERKGWSGVSTSEERSALEDHKWVKPISACYVKKRNFSFHSIFIILSNLLHACFL